VRSHVGASANPYRFTGELQDSQVARGLYYLRARCYDPALGRFLSRDPVPGFVTDIQSQNRYVYVSNDCVNFVDPSGELLVGPPPILRGEKIICTGAGKRSFVATNAAPKLFPTGGNDILEALEWTLRIFGHGQSEPHRQFTVEARVTVTIRNREAKAYARVVSGEPAIGASPQIKHTTGKSSDRFGPLQPPSDPSLGVPGKSYYEGYHCYHLESGQYPRYVRIKVLANPLLTDWVYDPESFGFDLECSRR
jgi:RHS repeat-associated protein